MTNFEYFKDDIIKMCADKENILAVRDNKPVLCRGLSCLDCDLFKKLGRCKTNVIQWLYLEHEEKE